MADKIVDSKAYSLKLLFSDKYDVDFYQREYVWQTKQLEDLINDLSSEFLKNWNPGDSAEKVKSYDPYFMGEIVVSTKEGHRSAIIDGQQRITTFSLLLIYLIRRFGDVDGFPKSDIEHELYSNDFGKKLFTLNIDERNACMKGLFENGAYVPNDNDRCHVQNLIDRYNDFDACWNENINNDNIVNFAYWLNEKIVFSKVWTNNDEFAYVVFETMNDRGLSLTQVEMLRSYLLAKIDPDERNESLSIFDKMVNDLISIKLNSKSKPEFEFFKIFLRGHYAESLGSENSSDFTRIGKEFHRWVRDNSNSLLKLHSSKDYIRLINEMSYFAKQYKNIYSLIASRDTSEYFYLIVNNDYNFTLQPALILSALQLNDSDDIVKEKIQIVSKYLTKILTWRIWNHWQISQSALESSIYQLSKAIREKEISEIKGILSNNPINIPDLNNPPTLNKQNRPKIRVLLSLITEIVARNSGESNYMLNKDDIEVEHIWSDHYEEHLDEFDDKDTFAITRNNIGDLLVLPKSFNASYNDSPYSIKVVQYFNQNILAQTLNQLKYEHNPGFINFKNKSCLEFKPYEEFKHQSINERAELYKQILIWNWNNNEEN